MNKIALALLLLATPLAGVRYPVVTYNSSHGLPQNRVHAMIQDRFGYIWVGTQSGIGRFDGHSFTVFTSRDGLPGNYVTDFELGEDGDIWIATQEGLCRFKDNRFLPVKLPANDVIDIQRRPGELWILTGSGVFMVSGDRVLPYRMSLLPGEWRGLAIGDDGTKYAYSENLLMRHREGGTPEAIQVKHLRVVKALGPLILLGTDEGLFKLSENGRLETYLATIQGLGPVNDVLIDRQGNTWIGTGRGVVLYNRRSGESLRIDENSGLFNHEVLKLFQDRQGNVFIGAEYGLYQLSQHFFRMYGVDDGLPGALVWDMMEDEGALLLAADGGLARVRDGKVFPCAINDRLSGKSLRAVVRTKNGRFLIGCRQREIFSWDGRDRLEKIYEQANVLHAVADATGNVWFATDRGLLRYDGQRFNWYRQGLRDPVIWDAAVVGEEALLVGTRKGVQNFIRGTFTSSPFGEAIGDTVVNDIRYGDAGALLVSTENQGLFICTSDGVRRVTSEQGLINNDVWFAIADGAGGIWLNTSRSLDRLRGDSISHFNRESGLFGDEGSLHAAARLRDGRLYFGIFPGLVEFVPTAMSGAEAMTSRPLLYVTGLKVNGRVQDAVTSGSLQASRLTTLELRHDQNTVEFEYMAVSTLKENPVAYKTRLSGFDNKWSLPTPETAIRYTNLPAGNYRFLVVANIGEASWFAAENGVALAIARPFWRTWWFRLLGLTFFLTITLLLVRVRIKTLERQKEKLEDLVRQRTAELADRNRELAYLSVTDPLTDLKNRRYMEEKIKEDIHLIRRSLFDVKNGRKGGKEKETSLGLYMLDIDHFKRVNDQLGHQAGDIIIVEIARLLLRLTRDSDTVVRWGGEEYLVITRQAGEANLEMLAERLRLGVERNPFTVSDQMQLKKSVSIGFALFPFIAGDCDRVNWQQAVSLVDHALYVAKNRGRNRTVGIAPGSRDWRDVDVAAILADPAAAVDAGYLRVWEPTRSK